MNFIYTVGVLERKIQELESIVTDLDEGLYDHHKKENMVEYRKNILKQQEELRMSIAILKRNRLDM